MWYGDIVFPAEKRSEFARGQLRGDRKKVVDEIDVIGVSLLLTSRISLFSGQPSHPNQSQLN